MKVHRKYEYVSKTEASPLASSLIESLRDLGYTPETAVSDIIDNAIFAGAKNIWIDFLWNSLKSRVTFRDDGKGMDRDELAQAMRPGSRSPAEERAPDDLGRFGLGLKTASFSQCRKFTVLSKTRLGAIATWCWDLDYVISENGGWNILEIADEKDVKMVDQMEAGTMIVWEDIDRVVGTKESSDTENSFLEIAEKVKRYLELVFHRYLETGKLKVIFNGYPIAAWDPFLRGESATQPFPEETFAEGQITVRPYVLPHRSKLDEDTWLESEKRGGWDNLQGFYIYRNDRLLLAADWLGFTRKKSYYKLARIMINLPNHLDQEWQIDIKKSRAKPPAHMRQGLKSVAFATMAQAEQVFRHRGKEIQRSLPGDFSFVWQEVVKHERYFFRINPDHPSIAAQISKFPGKRKELKKLFRLLEETIPGPAIIAKESAYPDSMVRPFEEIPSEELIFLMKELWQGWKKHGDTDKVIKRKLLMTEPFSDYPQLIESLTDER